MCTASFNICGQIQSRGLLVRAQMIFRREPYKNASQARIKLSTDLVTRKV